MTFLAYIIAVIIQILLTAVIPLLLFPFSPVLVLVYLCWVGYGFFAFLDDNHENEWAIMMLPLALIMAPLEWADGDGPDNTVWQYVKDLWFFACNPLMRFGDAMDSLR